MSKKIPTIKDVARAANVSIATVSRVVNQTGKVSQELASRVNAAIKELNFYPNSIARSLKTQNTGIVALVVSNIQDPFFTVIARGIEDAIEHFGYNLIVSSTDSDPKKEMSYLRILQEKKVDGIVLNHCGYNEEFIAQLSQTMPIVLSNRRVYAAGFKGDFVDNDNVRGSYSLTKHLLDLNHQKIGFINGPIHLSTAKERLKGFCQAMAEAGLTVSAQYPYGYYGSFSFNDGYLGAKRLMEQEDRPTAIIAFNSELVLGALHYLKEKQIAIPQDLSVACFGGIQNREILYVQPTLVSTNLKGTGSKAAEFLMDRIHDPSIAVNREFCFETVILPGNSSWTPAK